MKLLGIVVLLTLEILAVFQLSSFGLENIFALWGGGFFILFYRQFVNFNRAPSVHSTPGGNISGAIYNSHHIMLESEELAEARKHNRAVFKNMSIKLVYLTLTLAHIGLCYYFLKFPS